MCDSSIKLSVVVPCYNSANMIGTVVDRIIKTARTRYSDGEFEIILVNDYSADNTKQVISNLANAKPFVRSLSLSKNFGQQSAMMAGFSLTKGELVLTIDDDGETPPEHMFSLIDALYKNGYDAVFAKYRNDERMGIRRLGSLVNDKMATWLLGKPNSLVISNLGVIRRYVIEQLVRHKTPFPYAAGQLLAITHNIGNVVLSRGERIEGRSGYTFRKLVSFWLNGFLAFSVRPLRVASIMGLTCSFIGFLIAVIIAVNAIIQPYGVSGWASTICAILIVGGLILLALGLSGEYIGRIYMGLNGIPQYVIRPWFDDEDNRTQENNCADSSPAPSHDTSRNQP